MRNCRSEEIDSGKRSFRAVIFDLDDTLINTDNLAPYLEKVKKTKQGTEEHKAAWKELYEHIPESTTYAGMSEVFEFIRDNNVPACICSNSSLNKIKRLVKAFNIPVPRECWIGAYSCGSRYYPKKKPDPAQYIKALAIMDADPENVVVFGNEDCDIMAAHKANLYSVGCTWGNSSKDTTESLIEAKPDLVIENPIDIITIIQMRICPLSQ